MSNVSSASPESKTPLPPIRVPIWLDCDPGQDDAFAIIFAAYAPELRLIGVSTIGGNAPVETTYMNARKFMWASGIEGIPVVKGCDSFFVRGTEKSHFFDSALWPERAKMLFGITVSDQAFVNGFDALPEVNEKYEKYERSHPSASNSGPQKNPYLTMYEIIASQAQKVVIVAVGPLTNVAILLRAFPEVKEHIAEIVFMGGASGQGNATPAAEANIENDPEAASVVVNSGLPIRMVPLEVTLTFLISDQRLEQLLHIHSTKNFELVSTKEHAACKTDNSKEHEASMPNLFGKYLYTIIEMFFKNHALYFKEYESWSEDSAKRALHDPVAVGFVIDEIYSQKPEFFDRLRKSTCISNNASEAIQGESVPSGVPKLTGQLTASISPDKDTKSASIFKSRIAHVDVECKSEFSNGRTNCRFLTKAGIAQVGDKGLVEVATRVEPDTLWDWLLSAIVSANARSPVNIS